MEDKSGGCVQLLSKKMEIIQNIAIMSILDNYGYNMDQNPYYEVDKR